MRRALRVWSGLGVCAVLASGVVAAAQSSDPLAVPVTSSLFDPYYGSVLVDAPQPETLALSFDDALRLGLENNLGLVYARENEQTQRAQRETTLNVLLPQVTLHGEHGLHQLDLEAAGFRPGLLTQIEQGFPELSGSSFPLVVKVNTTVGQANLSQYLFNWAGYDAVKALKHAEKAAVDSSADARARVVERVGTAYLRVIAEQAEVENIRSLVQSDEHIVYQSTERHKAGVVANLDELRARVSYQAEQQGLIEAENNLEKAKIVLNREIGLAPGQEIKLSDAQPYADLHVSSIEDARAQAMVNREDYQALVEQVAQAEDELKAAHHERLPTLKFNGNYGITGVTGLVYHGTWGATGTLDLPVFKEAQFRSDRDTAEYQLQNAKAKLADLRGAIDQQLRNSLIDVRTAEEEVTVAKSNLELSHTSFDQAKDRFQGGVEDNLPSIQAVATTRGAISQYSTAVFQLNQARLELARNLGLIDTAYHPEIPGGRPAMLISHR